MSSTMSTLIMLALLAVMMYFMMIRPQRKQRDAHQDMMSKLKPGDHVVTIGRLHGVVSEVNQKEQIVTLDCEGIYLTFDLVAIQRVVTSSKDSDSAADSASADSQAAADSATDSESADKADEQ